MSNFLTALISVTVVLGVMIFVHEWGHFIAAKLCGVRVDVFSFGLGPRVLGVKRGDTDYRLSAFPFGGYVRMAGDNPVEERSGAPYEFLSRPRWQRFLIAVAGPAMNVLLAFVIFWGILWFVGVPFAAYLHQPADVVALPAGSAASAVQPGDRILSVNGHRTFTWEQALDGIAKAKPGDTLKLVVSRAGREETLSVTLPAQIPPQDVLGYPEVPPIVGEILPGLPADKSGLRPNDRLVSINGKDIKTWPEFVDSVHRSEGQTLHLLVRRDSGEVQLEVTPKKGANLEGKLVWQIGVVPKEFDVYQRLGLFSSVKQAGRLTVAGMGQILDILGGLFTGRVSVRELQGVVGIARVSGQAAKEGPLPLLELMASISLNLGLLNLLPIPILDGGHVLLLAIEGTLRRDLSVGVKERFVEVGLVFLLAIIAFVMYSDIIKLIQSR